ncbi:hypothetical protein AT395_08135 [Pandoraea apista]|nr:hypothetical protein AT395_08135 [Pandoraea apista]
MLCHRDGSVAQLLLCLPDIACRIRLVSVWAQESGHGADMLSGAGAKGHFQFTEATAKQYGLDDPNDL